LNNALAPILMGLQLLQKERQDEETQRMLSVMEENTHRGADMVRQVLLFCRGRDSEQESLSPGPLMQEVERIVRQTFSKSIDVAALVPADVWPVLGNATQLHQVLLNLCVNARDAMPNGGELTLAADNVELTEAEAGQIPNGVPGRFVMLLVSDTGCGIPPELQTRIFEPFFTTKPIGKGTGLGLSTVGRIVAQHRGFINVKSQPGQGTTFEIYLPFAKIAPRTTTGRRSDANSSRGHGELILIADDEESVCKMISLALVDHGYRVLTAGNGAEALSRFDENAGKVRLVLLDTDMPVMNGAQTIQMLRERNRNLPVVLMSGEIGAASIPPNINKLAKPFQLHELLTVVGRILA
jgi:two-component system cell cycle sensor histidine kinase/response regulator CckA